MPGNSYPNLKLDIVETLFFDLIARTNCENPHFWGLRSEAGRGLELWCQGERGAGLHSLSHAGWIPQRHPPNHSASACRTGSLRGAPNPGLEAAPQHPRVPVPPARQLGAKSLLGVSAEAGCSS